MDAVKAAMTGPVDESDREAPLDTSEQIVAGDMYRLG